MISRPLCVESIVKRTPNQTHIPRCDDLWDKYFMVKMLFLHSRPVEQIRTFGVRISGVHEIDSTMDKEEIVTQMCIDRMFEKHRSGVTIRVVNYNDTAEIYRIIHGHLITWAEYLNRGVNVGAAPLKELVELDAFASVVYDKAVSVFSMEERVSAIASNFLNVQELNFSNILKRAAPSIETRTTGLGIEVTQIAKASTANDVPLERSSFKDLFAEEINRISGWRKPAG